MAIINTMLSFRRFYPSKHMKFFYCSSFAVLLDINALIMETNKYDVIVVGAGLSGICAGYYLQKMCPNKNFIILEG